MPISYSSMSRCCVVLVISIGFAQATFAAEILIA